MSSSGTQVWRTVPPFSLLNTMTLVIGGLTKRKSDDREEHGGGEEKQNARGAPEPRVPLASLDALPRALA